MSVQIWYNFKAEIKKFDFRFFFRLFAILFIVVIVISSLIFIDENSDRLNNLRISEKSKLDLQSQKVRNEIGHTISDLLVLSDQLSIKLGNQNITTNKNIKKEFYEFLKDKPYYEKLVVFDKSGQELIRLNSSDGRVEVVSVDSLQSKITRPYFKKALLLENRQVLISSFEPNKEFGEFEIPYRPVLRFLIKTPLPGQAQEKIIMLSYSGGNLIQQLLDLNSGDYNYTQLVDSSGVLLISELPEDNIKGFLFTNSKEFLYQKEYPNAWNQLQGYKKTQFRNKEGLFTAERLSPERFVYQKRFPGLHDHDVVLADGFWSLISHIPNDYLESNLMSLLDKFFYPLGILVLFVLLLSISITHQYSRRKYHKKLLVDSNNRFRSILEESAVGIMLVNLNGFPFLANNFSSKLLGYSEEELKKMRYADFTHPDDRSLSESKVRELFEGKTKSFRIEKRYLSKNGKTIWADLTGTIVKDSSDDQKYIIGIIQDITKQKKMSEKMRIEKERAQQYLDIAGSMIMVINKDRTIRLINKRGLEILGVEEKEIIGKDWIECFIPEKRKKELNEFFEKLVKDNVDEHIPVENEIITKSGKIKLIHWNNTLIRDENGQIEATISSGTDITEQRNHENKIVRLNAELEDRVEKRTTQLKENIKELQLSEEKFSQLANNIEEVLWLKTEEEFLFLSPSYEKVFGISINEVYKNSDSFCHHVIKEDKHKATRAMKGVFKENENTDEEVRIKTENGTIKWIRLRSILFEVEGTKEEKRSVGIAEDITDLKKMQNDMFQSKEVAEKANLAKSEFLANMSHEIRTPMNSITGFTELLLRTNMNPKQEKYLHSIQSSTKSLLGIINDILDLSKVEAGKLKLQTEPVSILKIISEIEKVFRFQVEKKDLHFKIEMSEKIDFYLELDGTRIRQVLLNLIGNAVKFTEKGHIAVKAKLLELKEKENCASIAFEVEDTGRGIPNAKKQSIFMAFEQVDEQKDDKHHKGTGLGLAISQRLAKMMGGHIELESEEGKGSLFTLKLFDIPLTHARETDLKDAFNTADYEFEPAKILIADDIAENREIIIELFDETKIAFVEAENGEVAIEKMKKEKPDLILMDIRMPVMGGLEATRLIRKEPDFSHTPVIALTASGLKSDLERYKNTLFNDLILKPIEVTEVFRKISNYIGHKKAADTTQNNKTESLPGRIDISELNDVNDLLSQLKNGFTEKWNEVINSQVMGDIEEFATQLKKLSEKHNFIFLKQYASQILTLTDQFEIEELEQKLKEFPGLIELVENKLEETRNE